MRIGPPGSEKPAVGVNESSYVDVSDEVSDFDAAFFAGDGLAELAGLVRRQTDAGETVEFGSQRIGAPIARPHQILCIGLNYRDHAVEAGMPVPDEPVVFNKAPNTMTGPYDDVVIPRRSSKTDWEVELGIVVGRQSTYLPDEDAAREAIAGYVLVNDVSEREFQLERGGQWVKGKSAPTFNPCGPWLATPDEIGDVSALDMWLDVNGERRQTGNTRTMLFRPTYLVWYLSQFMTLEPGDLINTGTPPGVGMGAHPPVYLRPGDVMELGMNALGRQRHSIIAAQ